MKRLVSLLSLGLCSACNDAAGALAGEIGIYAGSAGGWGRDAGVGGAPFGSAIQARIQINGNDGPCGSCAVVVVQAQGGALPYTYAWSDPTLSGPGPHTLCPTSSRHLAVTVSDASSGELQRSADAWADLTCTGPAADAGPKTNLNGCMVLQETQQKCAVSDPSVTSAHSSRLLFDLVPGKPVLYTYDQLLPINLGVPSSVDVYLGEEPCQLDQKAFTIKLDSIWSQSYCFTPQKAHKYSTALIRVNGIPFTFGTTASVCDRCPNPPPAP